MDDALENALWNVAYRTFWTYKPSIRGGETDYGHNGQLLIDLWANHFGQAVDEVNPLFSVALQQIKKAYGNSDWPSKYDFIEFVANYPRSTFSSLSATLSSKSICPRIGSSGTNSLPLHRRRKSPQLSRRWIKM